MNEYDRQQNRHRLWPLRYILAMIVVKFCFGDLSDGLVYPPGPPTLSLLGDIVPTGIGLTAIILGFRRFRRESRTTQWLILVMVIVATLVISVTAESIVYKVLFPYRTSRVFGL